MAIYVGQKKCKLIVDGAPCQMRAGAPVSTIQPQISATLKTVDNFILVDKNGIYLIPKEDE